MGAYEGVVATFWLNLFIFSLAANAVGVTYPNVVKAHEQGLLEELVAHAAIKTLDVLILSRQARSDVVPLHAALAAPCEHGVLDEFGAVVAGDHAGLAPLGDQPDNTRVRTH